MENVSDPRQHVNEEPRHDLQDVMVGFGGMFLLMTVIFGATVIIKHIIS